MLLISYPFPGKTRTVRNISQLCLIHGLTTKIGSGSFEKEKKMEEAHKAQKTRNHLAHKSLAPLRLADNNYDHRIKNRKFSPLRPLSDFFSNFVERA